MILTPKTHLYVFCMRVTLRHLGYMGLDVVEQFCGECSDLPLKLSTSHRLWSPGVDVLPNPRVKTRSPLSEYLNWHSEQSPPPPSALILTPMSPRTSQTNPIVALVVSVQFEVPLNVPWCWNSKPWSKEKLPISKSACISLVFRFKMKARL